MKKFLPNSLINKEAAFLSKVQRVVEQNISDEHFGISQLHYALRISRTQLHRKLKAVTGKSASHVIRSIRMSKAKELLETTDLNVSEVSYAVGFSNRSYFTQVFTLEFGHPPSYFKRI